MANHAFNVKSFPTVLLKFNTSPLPVEVSLVAQLGHGAGNKLFIDATARQRSHQNFVDALDEPSTKLGGTDIRNGDSTALHTFCVGAGGHPFHRHAGHRVFTAVSGSGGTLLRFSSGTPEQLANNPELFFEELRHVTIPPDCMFTCRFGGGVWHQFQPLSKNAKHPTLFAISCHTNELGGLQDEELIEQVRTNHASIATLTELLPAGISARVEQLITGSTPVQTVNLSLDAANGSLLQHFCQRFRGAAGAVRTAFAALRKVKGFLVVSDKSMTISHLRKIPTNSILTKHLNDVAIHHDDTFVLTVHRNDLGRNLGNAKAPEILEVLLQGFLQNPPANVTRLMGLRNLLVRPLGLRTSHLGCPVSSLTSTDQSNLFAGRFPVIDQQLDSTGSQAQVILGANDKHLVFRSCVGVEIKEDRTVLITLGSRVHCKNLFGVLYLAAIARVHESYVSPAMLKMAFFHALGKTEYYESILVIA